jgi:Na+(H+)/acetate symporter ActP
MTGVSIIPLLFVLVMVAATIGLGIVTTRSVKSAADFFVAGRSVSVFWNASAISGEYLSAASFMGIAGLLMKNGYDILWYPVCYATGYLFLLLFIAGPLRRFGAYTIPDFAEGRFDSPLFRRIAVIFVLFIGFFYTMPQMKAAGITLGAILNQPYWVGIAIVGTVITYNVATGGMKGITVVQAFQYWAKLFAICVPLFILLPMFGGYSSNLNHAEETPKEIPLLKQPTTLKFKGKKDAPANAVAFAANAPTEITFPNGATLDKISPARKPDPGEDPMPATALIDAATGRPAPKALPPGFTARVVPFIVTSDGIPVVKDGKAIRAAPKIEFAEAAEATLAAGSTVPNSPANKKWIEPFGTLTSKYGHPLLYTYSLIIALLCGTAGLPHILVRFYTNPDGRAAKRTTLLVIALLGAFYLFTPIWGTLGRFALPSLYANNTTDVVVIKLPMALNNKLLGQILSGITSAGAFAAFMSTFSGLLVSMSGALAHDIYGKILKPNASSNERLVAFKWSAVAVGIISMVLGLFVESFDIAMLVGWAFAIAACSYFPLLLLGAWWRKLTMPGAAVGMLGGGTLALIAIISSMLIDKKMLTIEVSPIIRTLMEQPAIWGVPLSVSLMVIVSLLTRSRIPADIHVKMLRLHAPEEMGHSKNYIQH